MSLFRGFPRSRARSLFREDFTTLDPAVLAANGWTDKDLGNNNSETSDACPNLSIVDAPGRALEKCLQMSIGPGDWVLTADRDAAEGQKHRAQLIRAQSAAEGGPGANTWYTYSIRIPSVGWSFTTKDTTVHRWRIIGQFHDATGSSGLQPPISTILRTSGTGAGQTGLRIRCGCFDTYLGTPGDPDQYQEIVTPRDTWLDIIFNVQWATDGSGWMDTWVNDVQLPRMTGRNMYDTNPNRWAMGCYDAFAIASTDIFHIGRQRMATYRGGLGL